MQVGIIGGGAAGFLAAIAAAEQGATVTIVERNAKLLKKLGVTGNGRGNVLNASEPIYYGDAQFARQVLAHVGYPELSTYFNGLGIPLRQEGEGRIYPAALQASVVQDALLLRAEQLQIATLCLHQVDAIRQTKDGLVVQGQTVPMKNDPSPACTPFSLTADAVVVACGGAAAPAHGTDGSAYALLTAFGHHCTKVLPALCALKVPKKRLQGLAGQRVKATVSLHDAQDRCLHQTQGEILFGEDAVSGIAAMQLARFWQDGCVLHLNVQDEFAIEEPIAMYIQGLAKQRGERPIADLLMGTCTKPVARWLLQEAGIRNLQMPIHSVSASQWQWIANTIQDIAIPVTQTRGFAFAQVTAGGIATSEVDPHTMQSQLIPNLYIAGEMLNVDGECGGYNLMFAFASGRLAGLSAAMNWHAM